MRKLTLVFTPMNQEDGFAFAGAPSNALICYQGDATLIWDVDKDIIQVIVMDQHGAHEHLDWNLENPGRDLS